MTLDRPRADEDLVAEMEATHARIGREERRLLCQIAEMERRATWEDWGARDYPHFLSMRLGVSPWKARRMIAAAVALDDLPATAEALETGRTSLDKVVELTRFAGSGTEHRLLDWADAETAYAIRLRADVETARSADVVETDVRSRSVRWWHVDDRFRLHADLPAVDGARVAKAIDRLVATMPSMPDEPRRIYVEERRADALVALASARIAADAEPDRATIVVHARLDGLETDEGGCEIGGGPAVDPRTVRRMLCDARVQTIVENAAGDVVTLTSLKREPPPWMVRQVRYRDRQCRFPGCGATRFTQVHHIRHWAHGGRTELDNLLLICFYHHRLVHELRWKVTRSSEGVVRWYRPTGEAFGRAGPSP